MKILNKRILSNSFLFGGREVEVGRTKFAVQTVRELSNLPVARRVKEQSKRNRDSEPRPGNRNGKHRTKKVNNFEKALLLIAPLLAV